jgi:cyanophycin synthetase
MIRLETSKHFLWRNWFAQEPVFFCEIALGDARGTAAKVALALQQALREALPTAFAEGKVPDAPELIAALALKIDLAGDVATPFCAVAARDLEGRRARFYFSCKDQLVGEVAITAAIAIANAIVAGRMSADDFARALENAADKARDTGLYRTTRGTLAAAERKGIFWKRATPRSKQATLGQGHRQRHVVDTVMGTESAIARDFARSKPTHLELLSRIRLPTGNRAQIINVEDGLKAAERIGYPVVVKPVDGKKGFLVFVNLKGPEELRTVLEALPWRRERFMMQSFFPGDDHRMLVVDGKLLAAAMRIPASVIGDGKHSVAALVEAENRERKRRGPPIKQVVLDEEADRVLQQQDLTRDAVPPAGLRVLTRATANVSAGGSAIDVTDIVHPDNARVAVKAAKALGLTVAGVDFICPDIARSWRETGGGLCEVNSNVGLRPHILGRPEQDVAGLILETIYPPGDDGRIPTAMVTGTLGKTTVCYMLNSILTCAGHLVGMATTEGVYIGAEQVMKGDVAGPSGHVVALSDPLVTAAVLETARGGVIKKGMYLDRCDVAALTNVLREQIGMDGVATVEDMARVKRKVLEAATKVVVLNADDPLCLAMAEEFAPRIRTILFARGREAVRAHRGRGDEALFLEEMDGAAWIMTAKGAQESRLVNATELPSTVGGMWWQQAYNAMTAAGLAMGLGVETKPIVEGLTRYGREFAQVPARCLFAEDFPMKFLFEFTTNPPGFAQTAAVCDTIPVTGKRICAVSLPGNRPDWQYPESAAALAGHFERFIVFEREDKRRGVPPGEISSRLVRALIEAGADERAVSVADGPIEVAHALAREAGRADFVVYFGAEGKTPVDAIRQVLWEAARRAAE